MDIKICKLNLVKNSIKITSKNFGGLTINLVRGLLCKQFFAESHCMNKNAEK